jgi:hypothetical protein
VAERAWRVNGEYIAKARTLDHEHSRQADGTRYPGVREQVQGHLVGPVLAAAAGLRPGARPCGGLVSGLQRGAARPRAGGGGGEGDGDVAADGGACGACMRRWGSTRTTCTAAGVAVFWRSWAPSSAAACPSLGSRTPTTRYPSPRPAARVRARPRGCWRGRGVAAGAPRRCARAQHARRQACERRARRRLAGGYRLSRPCSG